MSSTLEPVILGILVHDECEYEYVVNIWVQVPTYWYMVRRLTHSMLFGTKRSYYFQTFGKLNLNWKVFKTLEGFEGFLLVPVQNICQWGRHQSPRHCILSELKPLESTVNHYTKLANATDTIIWPVWHYCKQPRSSYFPPLVSNYFKQDFYKAFVLISSNMLWDGTVVYHAPDMVWDMTHSGMT